MLADSSDTAPWRSSLLRFLFGATSGATAKSIIAPLDRVKIVFQISRTPFSFRGVGTELSRTYAAEGVRGLFKGNGAQILRICPYSGIQLTSFDIYSHALLRARGEGGVREGRGESAASKLGSLDRVLAGAAAGATSVAATYPLDVMRARLAVARETPEGAARFSGLIGAAREMIASGGVLSLYRGLMPTLFGILPYAGISFSTFEFLKSRARVRGAEPTTVERLVFGGVAGFAGQASAYPLDIVRRRMQTEGFTPAHAHAFPRAPERAGALSTVLRALVSVRWREGGAIDTLTRVYDAEGVRRGLFKGLSLNVIKGPIAVGVSFTTYDILKSVFHIDKEKND